uniref:Uncharacterized protein n=1 Tax=Lepeophtheirus salmonis TaxID=72036 RepID=A0A0K2VEI9_LEPSM
MVLFIFITYSSSGLFVGSPLLLTGSRICFLHILLTRSVKRRRRKISALDVPGYTGKTLYKFIFS